MSEGLSQLKVKLLQLFRVVGLLRHTAPLRWETDGPTWGGIPRSGRRDVTRLSWDLGCSASKTR